MPHRSREPRFLELLELHKGSLYRIARAYASATESVEDLVQEVVLQLWRSFPTFDEGRPFAAWMKRIALNVALSAVRRVYRRPRFEPTGEAILHVPTEPPEERSEDMAQVYAAIARLRELDRALLLLHLDDHAHEEIATILGLTVSNVATRLHRIKQRLRQDWRGGPGDGP